MTDEVVTLSDKTSVGLPIKNLISLVAAACVAVWGYFGIQERLNKVETNYILMQADVVKNSTFSRDWPLGKAGSLPQDNEQYMLIETLSKMHDRLQQQIESGNAPFDKQQALTLEFYKQRIEALERKMEILKDRVAQIKFSNGVTH